MRFLTWCGRNASMRIRPLVNSAATFGIQVEPVFCNGLMDKIQSLARYLETICDKELVICTDGYDCLYVNNPSEIESRILQFGDSVVFSAQGTPEHHLGCAVEACSSKYPGALYPMLNSGVIAGRCSNVKKMLSEICSWNISVVEQEFRSECGLIGFMNDQTLFGRYMAAYSGMVSVDINAWLSWTSAYENSWVDEILRQRPLRFVNPKTGEIPCLFHLPCTAPGVYLQFLNVYSSLGHTLDCDVVDIVRLEQLSQQQGSSASEAERILSSLRQCKGYHIARWRQYQRYFFGRAKTRIDRTLRSIIPR